MHLDVELTLWRNLVEATTASIALHINNSETVACVLTNALEACEQTRLNSCLQLLGTLLELLLFLACFLHNLVELVLLLSEGSLAVLNEVVCVVEFLSLVLYLSQRLTNFLVAKLYLQALKLYFLCERVILAVVLHVIELHLVTLHACLCLVNLRTLLSHGILKLGYLVADFLHTDVKTFNLVLQVLHLKRKFTAQRAFLVDSRQSGLELIKSLQLLFH